MQLRTFFYGAVIALIAVSCDNVNFKKTEGGMPYKLYPSDNGKKIEDGVFVKAHVEQKIKDSVIFSTYNSLPVYFQFKAGSQQPYDVSELFPLMKEGDSVYAVQAMDTFIKKNPSITQQTQYKDGDKITTSIKVLKVFPTVEEFQKDEAAEREALLRNEDNAVQAYLKKNNIQAQRTGKGTYVQVLEPGTGEPVDSGKYVKVMYKGQTFGGTVFDTNMDASRGHTDPLAFRVGVGQMIKGFDEGVQLLKEGGKARIYIPSSLGYGAQPPSQDIKPFEHLIFDVEVIDVSDQAPPQPQQ